MVVALVIALALAACGGGSHASTTTAAPTTTTTAAPSSATAAATTTGAPTSTTTAQLTVQQVASLVAPDIIKYRAAVAKEEACTALECFFLQQQVQRWEAIHNLATTITAHLNTSPIPAELKPLVARVQAAYNSESAAWQAWYGCLQDKQTRDACTSEETTEKTAWEDFGSVLDGWRAYGI
jgi:hypothetical protein